MKRNMIIALGTLGLAPAAVAAPRTMPPSAALSVQQQRMASQPKTPQLKPYLLKESQPPRRARGQNELRQPSFLFAPHGEVSRTESGHSALVAMII